MLTASVRSPPAPPLAVAVHNNATLSGQLAARVDELRRSLVPTAGPHSVGDIVKAARGYFRATGRRVTFEYALIRDVNDTPEIARQTALLLRPTGGHVNLIPVNPTAGGYGRPDRRRVLDFQRILREGGVNCTVRVEKGSEISAACGQLRTDEAKERALIQVSEDLPSVRARGRLRAGPGPARSQPR